MRSRFSVVLATAAALVLPACAHEREFRVAYVGSEGSAQIAGDDAGESGQQSPPVVAAGNALLGPTGGPLGSSVSPSLSNGTVTTILPSTQQTLVQLTNGTTVLLNGVGGSTPLVGTNVLNATNTLGQVVNAPLSSVGALVSPVTGTSAVTNVTGTTTTVTNILTRPLSGICC